MWRWKAKTYQATATKWRNMEVIWHAFWIACLNRFIAYCMEWFPPLRSYQVTAILVIRNFVSHLRGRQKVRFIVNCMKPIGRCVYCFGSWIVIFVAIIYDYAPVTLLQMVAVHFFFQELWQRYVAD